MSRGVRIGLPAIVLACGCAYYNGLYNANRLAGAAERADRQGRPGEATALWAQAAVKAESVVARYPKSKHRDDASLLQGRALRFSRQCGRAIGPLESAAETTPDPAIRNAALLALGQCLLELGRPDSAVQTFSLVVSNVDSVSAGLAKFWRGRALMSLGDYHWAVSELEASAHPEAGFALAIAYSRLERRDAAIRVLRGHQTGRYQESLWLATLDSLASSQPTEVANVVDELVPRRELRGAQRARLLLSDGQRWSRQGDDRRAAARFAAATRAAPDSAEGKAARGEQFLAELRMTDDPAYASMLRDSIELAQRAVGQPMWAGAIAILGRLRASLVSDTAGAPDFKMFLVAEELRDSLRAIPLAAQMFRDLQSRYPASLIAPKALLAAAVLDSTRAASLMALLEAQYPTSPYALAMRGFAADGFAAVEDSLLRALGSTERPGELGAPRLRDRRGTEALPKKPRKPDR